MGEGATYAGAGVDIAAGDAAVERLREYYNPFTGEGMGATDFAWSSLITEMLARDPRAARSYL